MQNYKKMVKIIIYYVHMLIFKFNTMEDIIINIHI
jgi:hypothetical protein